MPNFDYTLEASGFGPERNAFGMPIGTNAWSLQFDTSGTFSASPLTVAYYAARAGWDSGAGAVPGKRRVHHSGLVDVLMPYLENDGQKHILDDAYRSSVEIAERTFVGGLVGRGMAALVMREVHKLSVARIREVGAYLWANVVANVQAGGGTKIADFLVLGGAANPAFVLEAKGTISQGLAKNGKPQALATGVRRAGVLLNRICATSRSSLRPSGLRVVLEDPEPDDWAGEVALPDDDDDLRRLGYAALAQFVGGPHEDDELDQVMFEGRCFWRWPVGAHGELLADQELAAAVHMGGVPKDLDGEWRSFAARMNDDSAAGAAGVHVGLDGVVILEGGAAGVLRSP